MNSSSDLERLVHDGVVDEVLQQIKSGKEADVYLVRKGEGYLAAKVYKARHERNFKNNAGYLEGRNIRSSRDARAIAKGSRYGREKQEQAWKTAEVDALYKLAAAGVRVPAPDIYYEGVLVMALVVDAEGQPAPRLADVRFTPEHAKDLYLDLIRQAGIMLTCDLIHGDLSAFNVLLAHDGPTIIDLPQVINAAGNAQAERFFRRDISNLHNFFVQFAPELARHPDGGSDIWNRYRRRELFAGYVPDLANLKDDSPPPPEPGQRQGQQQQRPRHGGNRPHAQNQSRPNPNPQRPHGQPQNAQRPQNPNPQRPHRQNAQRSQNQQRPHGQNAHRPHAPNPNANAQRPSGPQVQNIQRPQVQQANPQRPRNQNPNAPRTNVFVAQRPQQSNSQNPSAPNSGGAPNPNRHHRNRRRGPPRAP